MGGTATVKRLVSVQKATHLFHELGYVTKMEINVTRSHLAFIEILMQAASHFECDPDLLIACFSNNAAHHFEEVSVPTMLPPLLLRDGIHNLSGSPPTLLAGLQKVSASELLRRLRKVVGAAI